MHEVVGLGAGTILGARTSTETSKGQGMEQGVG